MLDKEYWIKKLSKIQGKVVTIESIYYYNIVTDDIIKQHSLFCKADRGIN